MANFCSNCGKQLYPNEDRCPSCGMYVGAGQSRENTAPGDNGSQGGAGQGYNGQGYNGQGCNGQGCNGQGYNNSQGYNQGYNGQYYNNNAPYNNGGYAPNYYVPPQPVQKRPLSVGLIIFSILNILFGCCSISSILGIAALIVTINASSAQTDADEISKKNISLILNIIGVALLGVCVVYVIIMLALA